VGTNEVQSAEVIAEGFIDSVIDAFSRISPCPVGMRETLIRPIAEYLQARDAAIRTTERARYAKVMEAARRTVLDIEEWDQITTGMQKLEDALRELGEEYRSESW